MVRTHSRACAVSVTPGNSRRSSTAADSSPRCSKAARIAAASASETTNILGAWGRGRRPASGWPDRCRSLQPTRDAVDRCNRRASAQVFTGGAKAADTGSQAVKPAPRPDLDAATCPRRALSGRNSLARVARGRERSRSWGRKCKKSRTDLDRIGANRPVQANETNDIAERGCSAITARHFFLTSPHGACRDSPPSATRAVTFPPVCWLSSAAPRAFPSGPPLCGQPKLRRVAHH